MRKLENFKNEKTNLLSDFDMHHINGDLAMSTSRYTSCSCIVLDAFTGNFPAHRFYYNQGYEPRGFHFIKTIDENGFS
jgi:hypothetical protein